jgi:hypothetical protein
MRDTGRQRDSARCQMHKIAAGKYHSDPLRNTDGKVASFRRANDAGVFVELFAMCLPAALVLPIA